MPLLENSEILARDQKEMPLITQQEPSKKQETRDEAIADDLVQTNKKAKESQRELEKEREVDII